MAPAVFSTGRPPRWPVCCVRGLCGMLALAGGGGGGLARLGAGWRDWGRCCMGRLPGMMVLGWWRRGGRGGLGAACRLNTVCCWLHQAASSPLHRCPLHPPTLFPPPPPPPPFPSPSLHPPPHPLLLANPPPLHSPIFFRSISRKKHRGEGRSSIGEPVVLVGAGSAGRAPTGPQVGAARPADVGSSMSCSAVLTSRV